MITVHGLSPVPIHPSLSSSWLWLVGRPAVKHLFTNYIDSIVASKNTCKNKTVISARQWIINILHSTTAASSNHGGMAHIIKKDRFRLVFCCHLQGDSPYSLVLCLRPVWWRFLRHPYAKCFDKVLHQRGSRRADWRRCGVECKRDLNASRALLVLERTILKRNGDPV